MKRLACLLLILILAMTFSHHANAQLWKRIENEVKTRAEYHMVNDAGNVTDKAIDKTEDAAVNAIKGHHHNENNNSNVNQNDNTAQVTLPSQDLSPASTNETVSVAATPTIAFYKNYDFVTGDQILFETNFVNQQDAELPARLGTLNGTAEIQTYHGEKVLHLEKGNNVCLIPIMDSTDYLPAQFTIEFDMRYNDPNPKSFNSFSIQFYKPDKTQRDVKLYDGNYHFLIYEADQIDFGPSIGGKELSQDVERDLIRPDTWHHIAIYIHNNIGKAYIDQYRVAASNMMIKGATKLAIKSDGRMEYMIKNIRIAGGGSDAYHKIMTTGKLVTHGIRFASNKADILPESMGAINEVYNILKNHPNLKFKINGYTDNDGNADLNMKLSQKRANAVKKQLIDMGIDVDRLTTKGFGEEDPIDTNTTPEGKANNRRVEFVKK